MKNVVRIAKAAVVISALFVGSTLLAQTFDGFTPAQEIDCDNYSGAAYGLCVAYCEAQDCDVNPHPSCEALRRNFEKRTGTSIFPCDPRCGDGVVNQINEECDDGNSIECDGCSNDCQIQPPTAPGCNPGFPGCEGATCNNFIVCNAGSTCGFSGVCGTSTVDGVTPGPGFCVLGSTNCSGLTRCPKGQSQCAANEVCFTQSCCGDNVCVPDTQFCSGNNSFK
ncbi:MAG: DUF4215 domain-containing protein [Bdellovibrionales bacterium]|nr:DUF4215 domain-containing protein [Bdellovibrionales bacterium]